MKTKNLSFLIYRLLLFVCNLTLAIFYLFSNFVYAAGLVPCGGPGEPTCTFNCFFKMFHDILYWALLHLAIPLVGILIVYGAVRLMLSAGSPSTAEHARKIITSAIIGAALALSAWLIINTIFSFLVKPDILGQSPFLEGSHWYNVKIKCP